MIIPIQSIICKTIIEYAVYIGWVNGCIPLSIITSECLSKYGIDNKLKKGFLHMTSFQGKSCVFHCWVEVKNNIEIDISSTVNSILIHSSKYITERILSENILDGYTRIDINTEKELLSLIIAITTALN